MLVYYFIAVTFLIQSVFAGCVATLLDFIIIWFYFFVYLLVIVGGDVYTAVLLFDLFMLMFYRYVIAGSIYCNSLCKLFSTLFCYDLALISLCWHDTSKIHSKNIVLPLSDLFLIL